MRVSIITVTLNSEKYLTDCIDSVRSQNYTDIEHIIIDGNSTDDTLRIIQNNEPNISTWISEPDDGMYDAINKGIELATGDIIGVLNSDDMFASADVISEIVESFKRTGSDSIYGDLVYVEPEQTDKVSRYWKGLPYKRSRFKMGWMPAHPTFYIKRSVVEKYGSYVTHYFTAADYEFMARYLFHHHVSATYLPKMIVKMRNGGISNGNIYRRLRANRRDYLAMKRNNIPFPFIVSIIKPLSKLPQYSKNLNQKMMNKNKEVALIITSVSYFRTSPHHSKITG
ncbi:MAG: glycosyltransferase family 2 protein [Ginsengibacter sp.]